MSNSLQASFECVFHLLYSTSPPWREADRCSMNTQKVASAWSRSNLPPQELDTMFRSIEGIYKANRSLLAVSRLSMTLPLPAHS